MSKNCPLSPEAQDIVIERIEGELKRILYDIDSNGEIYKDIAKEILDWDKDFKSVEDVLDRTSIIHEYIRRFL